MTTYKNRKQKQIIIMEKKELIREEVLAKVQEARRNPEIIVKMLSKHKNMTAFRFEHGQLHLEFDDRKGTSYNMDLLKLMPYELKQPVMITSWKGSLYVHSLSDDPWCLSGETTATILTDIIMKWGEEKENNYLLITDDTY